MKSYSHSESNTTKSSNDTQLRQWVMLKCIPQFPRQINAGEIMARLAAEGFVVSKRTVERDLISLSAIFPIFADETTRPYLWSWSKDAQSFTLPSMSPLQALTLELAHDHLANLLPASLLATLAPYFKCSEGILSSGDGVQKMASWRKKVAIVPPNQPLLPPDYPAEIIEAVHSALLTDQQLEISYTSRDQGETKTGSMWFVVGCSKGTAFIQRCFCGCQGRAKPCEAYPL